MNKFTKIPVQIEAFLVADALACTSNSRQGLPEWLAAAFERGDVVFVNDSIRIQTLEGVMTADRADWIIQGVKGELYPCKPDIFALTYQPVDAETAGEGLTFGAAIDALKAGLRVARTGWNGKGMFVFMRPGTTLSKSILPSINTLPSATQEFLVGLSHDIEFLPYLCLWSATGEVVNGWQASQSDMLAEDWLVV